MCEKELQKAGCTRVVFSVDDRFSLHDIPFRETFRIYAAGDDFFGNGMPYRSEELSSPTWLELCIVADEMIKVTGDHHHIFLEDLRVKDGKGYFGMGS